MAHGMAYGIAYGIAHCMLAYYTAHDMAYVITHARAQVKAYGIALSTKNSINLITKIALPKYQWE